MGYSGRYHAASLAAVFVALAIGILIGVGTRAQRRLGHDRGPRAEPEERSRAGARPSRRPPGPARTARTSSSSRSTRAGRAGAARRPHRGGRPRRDCRTTSRATSRTWWVPIVPPGRRSPRSRSCASRPTSPRSPRPAPKGSEGREGRPRPRRPDGRRQAHGPVTGPRRADLQALSRRDARSGERSARAASTARSSSAQQPDDLNPAQTAETDALDPGLMAGLNERDPGGRGGALRYRPVVDRLLHEQRRNRHRRQHRLDLAGRVALRLRAERRRGNSASRHGRQRCCPACATRGRWRSPRAAP